MICTVDIGNSNIVVGLMDNPDKPSFTGRIRSDRQKTVEEFMVEVKTLLSVYEMTMDGVDGAIISSVVPELTDVVKDGIEKLAGVRPMVVGHGVKTGIKIATDHPASLGSDLVVDAVAGSDMCEGPLAIFDLGTATTVSVVDGNKTYLGTLIMPGIKISQDALSAKCSQLPYIRYEKPKHMIGRNTIESMQGGLLYGNAAMIDGMIERIEEELGQKVTVIATGGISAIVMPFCKKEIIYDEWLLLRGLYSIYYKNAK